MRFNPLLFRGTLTKNRICKPTTEKKKMKIKIKAKLAHRCVAIVSLMFKLANNNKLHNFYAATSSQQFKFNVVWLFQRPRAATTLFLIGHDWSDLIKENFAFAICKIQKKKKAHLSSQPPTKKLRSANVLGAVSQLRDVRESWLQHFPHSPHRICPGCSSSPQICFHLN